MASDPQVDLIFSHFTPRYVATGVDPNDLQLLKTRIAAMHGFGLEAQIVNFHVCAGAAGRE